MGLWYRTGTISVTNGTADLTGSGTAWVANAAPGMMVVHDREIIGEVQAVNSNTSITLASAYVGTTISDAEYAIANLGAVRDGLIEAVQEVVTVLGAAQDGALAGRFDDGTLSEPGLAFADDIDTGFYRPGANRIAATKVLEAPSFGGAGVQSSNGDLAVGRVMLTGAGGILGAAPRQHDAGWSDFDDLVEGGIWTLGLTDLANGPLGAAATAYNGTCMVLRRTFSTGESITQIVSQGGELYWRSGSFDPMSWRPWRLVYNSENFGEFGSTPNGWYQRLPNGLQVCGSPDFDSVDVTTATGSLYRNATPIVWNLPASFTGGNDTMSGGLTSLANSQTHFGTIRVTGGSTAEITVFAPASVTGRSVRAHMVGLWE
ncbi:hypothetical protein [uncultured Roseovarius sp.]|uniref:hypothetical protein n=1 Tax=uncultured Roseovarius sp. TaxID=293344 RepID=UPI002625F967|nr:hypothetical protein [uncultured Roseovarius sp.]